jgi:preprotein translocase subunit SecD
MLNKFPWWKNLLLVIIIVLGILYALPNLYGDDPSVQISGNSSTAVVNEALASKVSQVLKQDGIPYKAISISNNILLTRFYTTDSQFKARTIIKSAIDNNFTVAINLAPATPAWLNAIGAKPMKLGLDLRGGIHFLLDVDIEGVAAKRLDGLVKGISDDLRKQNIRYLSLIKDPKNQIIVTFRDATMLQQASDKLSSNFPDLNFAKSNTNPLQLIAVTKPSFLQDVRRYAMEQTITTYRKRINELGIAEPIVQQQGSNRISIDLPGVQDSAHAKQILGGTATLEFHMVNTTADVNTVLSTGVSPPGTRIYHMDDGAPILLDKQVVLSGNSITSAASSFGEDGRPNVTISLGGGGEAYFSRVTRDNIGHQMAIVYVETKTIDTTSDGKSIRKHQRIERVISAPVIQSALGNNFQITGLTDALEARNLALLLRAGALPANVDIVQEHTIGPSLGQENVRMGRLSVDVAFVLIVVFMVLYYALFGVFADLALALNLVLIVAILSVLGATLTLPGIAGIVLTVGMAVDANVLIFERIREELRNGASPQTAIHAGFERAFNTIVDSNVSTLIVAVVLFSIGTGAIAGFAVTLTIGILTSMFTAITFTRALVNWAYGGRPVKHLAIGMKEAVHV